MKITFNLAAYTDAAGKFMPGAYLNGNEDNFYVNNDISGTTTTFSPGDDIPLLECGMLMAVADGMGGMNAGEVASDIAVKTIAEYFAPGRVNPEIASTHESRAQYLENLIVEADCRIKKTAAEKKECEGMGSTIILAWMVGTQLTVSWCGDSRAYCFNPANGITPLSKDHSYVQQLVDKGVISYEQSFDHPQGNIIVRSLGDTTQKAKPESRLFEVYQDDIILLCSDGLSGVLRDKPAVDENGNPYPGETLEEIIRANANNMQSCREQLFAAAERADWYDNVTAILCKVSNARPLPSPTREVPDMKTSALASDTPSTPVPTATKEQKSGGSIYIHVSKGGLTLMALLLVFLGSALAFGGYFFWKSRTVAPVPLETIITDSSKKDLSIDSSRVANPSKSTKVKNAEQKGIIPKVLNEHKNRQEEANKKKVETGNTNSKDAKGGSKQEPKITLTPVTQSEQEILDKTKENTSKKTEEKKDPANNGK